MEFKDRLMELRRQKGWSQEQLGERIGVTRQTVSKWETGETTPELRKLIELGELFQMTLDELVGRDAGDFGGRMAEINQAEEGYDAYGRAEWELKEAKEQYRLLIRHIVYEYKSERTLFGLPLVHVNLGPGIRRAKGIVAVGNVATGFLAVGGLSAGLFSFGGLSAGLLSLGGLSLGLLFSFGGVAFGAVALGGVAIGLLTFGGLSVGVYSIGGCAVASRVAAGGFAKGYIAIGEKAGGSLPFIKGQNAPEVIASAIRTAFPGTWGWLVRLMSHIG